MRYLRWALLAALCAGCDDGDGSSTADAATDGTTGDVDALPTDMAVDMLPGDMAQVDQGEGDMAVDMRVPDMTPDEGPMCEGAEGCDDSDRCTADDCVDGACVNAPIEGCCDAPADCADGVCLNDIGRCADATAPGSLFITEVMANPDAVGDPLGEWFEVRNVTDAPIVLNGWRIEGGGEDSHVIAGGADPIVVEPGAYFVFGGNSDQATNGGVAVDYEYLSIRLTNEDGGIALLDPFGTLIDQLAYDGNWPVEAGASFAIDPAAPNALADDDPADWCLGQTPWAGGDLGTPGAPNPPCAQPVDFADWCRLQFPLDAQAAQGEELTVYVRAFEEGVTDRTDATDPDAAFLVQVGFGADGSDPAAGEWAWVDAEPNAGWNAAEAGEVGNDEYQATFMAPMPGLYDHAGRVSADGGENWIYCDRAAGAGSDGAEDGYQIENAGSLNVIDPLCAEVDCAEPPAPTCDGNVRVEFAPMGVCQVIDGMPMCTYAEGDREDCEDQVCVDGACVPPAPQPGAGDLVITEILYDPHGPLAEEAAEWFEIYNRTENAYRLDGCRLQDSTNSEVIERLDIAPNGYLVFGRSDDRAVNGDIAVDHVFGFGLNNGGETITLTCGPEDAPIVIDTVSYDDGPDFPDARRASIALDPEANDPEANDTGANWCLAEAVYWMPMDQPEEEWHRGTPGAANPACPEPDVTVDWCRLQFPLDPVAGAGTNLTVYGRVYEEGVTDRSPMVDNQEGFMGELGYGAVGSQPGAEWTWIPAAPNPMWNDMEAPGNDEYQAELLVPDAGEYAFAYRFSRDAGETWLYCDRNAGPGADGAEDGYQPDNAGLLTSIVGPCDGVICDAPPMPVCDGDDRVTFSPMGRCEEIEGDGICAYPELREDCSADGGRCEMGACVGGAEAPGAGDLVINELMYDPHHSLSDGDAEWVEVLNVSDRPIDLGGCELYDSANTQLIEGAVVIEAGGYGLFGQNPDPIANGGLEFDAIFGFGLNNGGDTFGVRCGEVVIDEIAYDDGPNFPDAQARSIVLSDPAADNAEGANWCVASSAYFIEMDPALNNFGTPGALNDPCVFDPCVPNPCDMPPAAACADEDTRVAYPAVGDCAAPEGEAVCMYPPEEIDCAEGEVCMEGACVPVGARAPEPGEVIINELMYDPHFELADGDAEWFELHNPTDAALSLGGCTVADSGGGAVALDGLTIEPGGYLLFASNADPMVNGGLEVAGAFDFSLGNGGDSLTLTCPAGEIDTVAYDDGPDFPDARAHSLTLADPAADNADGANWCLGRSVYFEGAEPGTNNHGTPGAPNDPCDVLANFGVLQFPLAIDEEVGTEVLVYGRVYHPGITDRTAMTDPSPLLRAQLGFGPDATDPAVDGEAWTWINAAPNAGWNGPAMGQADNDEYQVNLRIPMPGEYDYAWRFSADGGRTWLYADGPVEGSSNGYQIENAGQMTSRVPADICDPNPCDTPPADECADPGTRRTFMNPGACNDLGEGQFECAYEAMEIPCAMGEACQDGVCVPEGLDPPAAGDLVINELLYDPHHALADGTAEWVEVLNVSDRPVELLGCELYDSANTQAIEGSVIVPPGGFALFGQNADPAVNGGLVFDALFGFGLNNGGDTFGIRCGEVTIDEIAYGAGFPAARAASLTLSDPAVDNADGANWCLGTSVYFVDPSMEPALNNLGTPGAPNDECPVLDLCDPNPCDMPPVNGCADANTRLVYPERGECLVLEDGFDCSYVPEQVPCEMGQACVDGACVAAGPRAPAAGEVVINEIMYDPHFALSDNDAEWFELHNPTMDPLTLDGCTVTDAGGGAVDLAGLTLEPMGYLVFASSDDAMVNGGLEVAGTFDFSLSNGGDSLTVTCAAGEIDTVAYDDGPAFPDARAHTLSLAAPALDNADGANWCLARSVYFEGAEPGTDNHGTPGAPNDPCDVLANFGVLQFPLAIDADEGSEVIVYGRVYHPGITDRTAGTDPSSLLRAQLGFGADGSDPAADGWIWINAAPNPDWDAAAQGGGDNDEYQVTLRVPAAGAYDYAWRFSADGGRSWLYADGPMEGSSNGYDPADAGQLISQPVEVDLCDPNPCDMPPAPSCQDENTVLEASPEGICEVVDGAPVCDYMPQAIPCGEGDVCVDGACVPAGARAPAAGELVINEILYDPHFDLSDNTAEWFELYNASADVLVLDGCTASENGGGSLALDGLQVEPGGYLLFVKSADEAVNGGLAPDAVFGFALGNGGDTLTITCAAGEIDAVTYDDGPDFPDARAHSISLDPAQLDDNANGVNWCFGASPYYLSDSVAEHNYGTPGAPNPPCDDLADFGRLQFPVNIDAAGPTTVYGRVYHEGITDLSPGTDVSPRLVAQLGYGADGSDPAVDDWTWLFAQPNLDYNGANVGEPNNDEYQATLELMPGVYDFAWRFSADGGRTWRYADGQPEGSSNGYQPENAGQANIPGEVIPF